LGLCGADRNPLGYDSPMPADPQEFTRLSNELLRLERVEELDALVERTLAEEPGHLLALTARGCALRLRGRHEEAAACLSAVLARDPQQRPARLHLAAALSDLGRLGEAEAHLRVSLQASPDDRDTWHQLARLLERRGPWPMAEDAYRRALGPRDPQARHLLAFGTFCLRFHRDAEAEAALRHALALEPDSHLAQMSLGMLLLAQGRLREGWPLYRARNRRPQACIPAALRLPEWQGEPLEGRRILLWAEQGHGDCIQFVRYAEVLKSLGAGRVIAAAPPHLAPLLGTATGVDEAGSMWRGQPPADCWVRYLDVPGHVGTELATIPAALPYLRVASDRAEAWAQRLPAGKRRVGLVWKGSAQHPNDAHRSLASLSILAPLWQAKDVAFLSLQPAAGDLPAGQPLVHLGDDLADFVDTAAVVSQLDLVICVDTAIAHVAGALGKPVWVLLPFVSTDWHWLNDSDDSPWYPGVMKLYRQPSPGNWQPVVNRVAADLAAGAC
jgi:Flp pilus assembly protein TadD